MNKIIRFILFIIVLSCTSPSEPELVYIKVNNFVEWEIEEQQMFSSLNEFRSNLGLTKLIPNKDCKDEANTRNQINMDLGTATHTGFPSTVGRLHALGFTECVNEVTAYGFTSVESVMKSFIESPSHNRTMINNCIEYAGASITYDNAGRAYFTIVLAR
jgi:uncharacterized protein YkwD